MSKKKVRFMCTAFRDGFQSVYGARVFTPDFLPAIAAAQDAGRFDDEIVPLASVKQVTDKESCETHDEQVTLEKDEGNRPQTSAEGLAKLEPVLGPEKWITAGNASQLSDGAAAVVLMEAKDRVMMDMLK